jgi:hypothetical protein
METCIPTWNKYFPNTFFAICTAHGYSSQNTVAHSPGEHQKRSVVSTNISMNHIASLMKDAFFIGKTK